MSLKISLIAYFALKRCKTTKLAVIKMTTKNLVYGHLCNELNVTKVGKLFVHQQLYFSH